MSRLVVSQTLLLSQSYPKTPQANIFIQWEQLGSQEMVNRVTFLAQISTLSYIVKNFKLGFLKKGSPKKFKTQDLKWSLSTCKKLLKHFFWDIFLFQDISEDRCVPSITLFSISTQKMLQSFHEHATTLYIIQKIVPFLCDQNKSIFF